MSQDKRADEARIGRGSAMSQDKRAGEARIGLPPVAVSHTGTCR